MIERQNQRFFRGLDLNSLAIDEAFVNVTSNLLKDLFIYVLNEECYKCPYQLYGNVTREEPTTLKLVTHHKWNFRIRRSSKPDLLSQFTEDKDTVCRVMDAQLGEFGVYDLRVDDVNVCRFEEKLPSVNSSMAILYSAIILVAFGLLFHLVNYIHYKKNWFRSVLEVYDGIRMRMGFEVEERIKEMSMTCKNNNSKQEESSKAQKSSRLNSLDVFRGITIAVMIFVNDGAGGYWYFEHATWNGLQLADVVFPWFMWIMGVCIPFSVKSIVKKDVPMGVSLTNVWRRSAKLFLLGFFWNTLGWINFAKLRVPGVLQRFAVAYFTVGTTAVIFAKSSKALDTRDGWTRHIKDIASSWQRWVVAFSILAAHQAITYHLPVPGCPKGYLGPGGLYDNGAVPGNCTGGAAGYIDKLILGENHIYSNPTPKALYHTEPFDPEGILGSLTTIFQVFLGYQAGQIIVSYQNDRQRIVRFLIWSLLTSVIGIGLCGASKDSGLVPLNKNIWSISFVMVTTGMAYFAMACIYWTVDSRRWWNGTPFLYAGLNSIVLYLGSYIAWNMLPFNFELPEGMQTHWRRLPESIWGVCCWLFVAYVMYLNKVFITV